MEAAPPSLSDRGVRDSFPDPTFSFVHPSCPTWTLGAEDMDVSSPIVMGVLNLTPDSFSDGGRFSTLAAAVEHAETMLEQGASILDVGGESTRPGAPAVDEVTERERILPFIREAVRLWDVPLSVDTRRASVAKAALDAGARCVNDVSGLAADAEMASTVAAFDAGLILMHMRGTPQTMGGLTDYQSVPDDVRDELVQCLARARREGISERRIALDPGWGFAKTAEQTLELVGAVAGLQPLGRPVVVGPSRKSFIGHVLGVPSGERLEGTIAACVLAHAQGARIFRVHDVGPVRRALLVADAAVRVTQDRDLR